jgi:dihydroorotase
MIPQDTGQKDSREPLLLHGGYVIDPGQNLAGPADVLLADGHVLAIGGPDIIGPALAGLEREGRHVTVYEVPAGQILTPGFIDLHVHLREPGYEDKETIATGATAAARGGFTTICCMPNTRPVLDSRATLDFVAQAARHLPARVLPIAAITRGEQGEELTEMHELTEAGAVAFSDDGSPVSNNRLMRAALEYTRMLDRPLIQHCEDRELAADGVMNEGVIATHLGLRGIPVEAEEIMLARDIMLVRLTGGRYHAAHVSAAGSVALLREAKVQGLRVTAEVTPHHLLLTDNWVAGERTGPLADALAALGTPVPPGIPYDTNTKVNPPLRRASDCAALLAGLLDGTIDAIATDHAPHSSVDKDCEYDHAAFGISGLETALASLLVLVHAGRLSLQTLIAALTSRPARAFGLPYGTLAPGAVADVTVFAPDEPWVVDPARFASKGKNTPLAGITLWGRVHMTILAGRIVMQC